MPDQTLAHSQIMLHAVFLAKGGREGIRGHIHSINFSVAESETLNLVTSTVPEVQQQEEDRTALQ